MILQHCSIENFGLLHEYELDLDRGFNSFLLKNGSGKSTLVNFIRAMFYGLEGDRRHSIQDSDRRRYRPWQGGRFGGSLTFSYGGVRYRIERFFGLRKSEDTFLLTNAETGRETFAFSEKIGQELFGMDAESFTNTLLIGQQGLAVHITSDIHAMISPQSESDTEPADIRNYREADRKLKEELNRLSPDRKTGLIYRKKEELAGLEAETRLQSQEQTGRKDALEERIWGSERTLLSARQKKEKADDLIAGLDEDFKDGLPDEEELRARIEELQYDNPDDRDDNVVKVPAHRSPGKGMSLLIFFLAFAGILTLLSGSFLSRNFLTAAGGILIFAALLFLFLCIRSLRDRSDRSEAYRDSSADVQKRKDKRKRELARLLRTEKDLVLYQRLDDYLNLLQEEAEAEASRQNHRDALVRELKKAEHRYQVLSLTREYLQQSMDHFSSQLAGPLLNSFRDYFSRISGVKEVPFRLDADLKLTLTDRGSNRDTGALSQGWQDIVGLCMRLALIDAMYPDDPPFLILDDPFVNMDQDNIQACLDLLTDLAGRYQILYFTCHESRC